MPVPKGTRYRFKRVSPTTGVRIAYSNNKVVEVTKYNKQNNTWVKSHNRRLPRRRK